MDMNESAKQKVLQQLIDLMDSKSVEGLKSKSPKFMKVETNDPAMAKEVVEEVTDSAIPTSEPEMPMEEPKEDEDMKRLMEMYKQLK